MNDNLPWTKKYAPKSSSEVVGQAAAVTRLKNFISNYKKGRKKAALIYGLTGCGKTSSVYAAANDLKYEILEVNASDTRNSESIRSVIGSASMQVSLFGSGKIILIDELDGISGRKDRGGASTLAKLISKSAFPIVLTANDPWNKKFSSLRRLSEMIEFKPIDAASTFSILLNICRKENVNADHIALTAIANRCAGDLRGAITDLQLLSSHSKQLTTRDVDELSDRNRTEAMLKALVKIFKTTDFGIAAGALDEVAEQPNDWFLWIDENLPSEYKNPKYLSKAYEYLSTADVFNGRIRRNQYWRFLVYIKAFLTAGIALSKDEKNDAFVSYKPTSRLLKLYIAKSRFQKRKAIAEKIAAKTHSSPYSVIKNSLPYLKIVFKHSKYKNEMADELDLDKEEIEWLSR